MEREIKMKPEDLLGAIVDACLQQHAVRSSVAAICLSMSLQGQLANDDSNDKQEHAERHDAGA